MSNEVYKIPNKPWWWPRSLKFRLVFIWIALIGTPIIALVFIIVRGPLDFSIFGQVVGHTTKELGLLMAGILFAVSLWQYHVLTRPDVKKLFRI